MGDVRTELCEVPSQDFSPFFFELSIESSLFKCYIGDYGGNLTNRKLVIYLHFVWGTQEWDPLITKEIERPVYRCIVDQIHKLGCQVLAINGVPDHIHLVVKLKSTVPVSLLIKQAKGVSSKFINDHLRAKDGFRWQSGYGAFTISRWDLPMIINYVKKQKTHHQDSTLVDELE